MHKLLVACLATVALGGCAMGVKHDYQRELDLGIATPATVAVATLDHRPYVVTGQKGPEFVGLSRGGFGNPFDVTTQSGQPLANDISGSIVASMKGKGVNARVVDFKPGVGERQAIDQLTGTSAQRIVMLTMRELKGDTMINVGFHFNLDLQVLDSGGKVLARKTEAGSENLGSGDPFSPGGGGQILPRFRRLMEFMFQDPAIAKALQL